jgi:hypothetical protein
VACVDRLQMGEPVVGGGVGDDERCVRRRGGHGAQRLLQRSHRADGPGRGPRCAGDVQLVAEQVDLRGRRAQQAGRQLGEPVQRGERVRCRPQPLRLAHARLVGAQGRRRLGRRACSAERDV